MNMILKLKHWQLFIVLMAFMTLYCLSAVRILSFDNFSSIELKTIFGLTGQTLFFFWVLLIGLSLNQIRDNPHHFSKVIFIISVLFCILGYGELHLSGLLSDGSSIREAISLILSPLTFLGIIYSFKNVSQSLRSIESGEKATFRNYILDAILIFMFPIGIWFIQPRLNRIYQMTKNK